jgi:hypothetical protein
MHIKNILATGALTLLSLAASAGDGGTVYGQVSTLGYGLGYSKSVSESWALRGQYSGYSASLTGNLSDTGSGAGTSLDGKLKMETLGLLADWYPFGGGFRMTLGAAANNNKLDFSGVGSVNGVTANVNGTLKFSSGYSPFVGIGYLSRPATAKGLGFVFELGVLFQDPKVDMTATGGGVTQADINKQKAKIEDDAQALRNYPVLALGISYAF